MTTGPSINARMRQIYLSGGRVNGSRRVRYAAAGPFLIQLSFRVRKQPLPHEALSQPEAVSGLQRR